MMRKNIQRMEYFERILQSKDRKSPKEFPQWTHKIIFEDYFLSAIKTHISIEQESTNQSFDNHPNLELLTINIVKNRDSTSDSTYLTPKVLSCASDEDIIELFM